MIPLGLLREKWDAAQLWFDRRPERERQQLSVAVAAGLLTLWLLLLHQPVAMREAEARAASAAASADVDRLRQELASRVQAMASDPRSLQRAELARLEQEVQELAAQASAEGASALPPREVVALLRELLADRPELRLVRVESLAPEAVELDRPAAAEASRSKVYRHPVEIEIEGAYLPALHWLRALAALPFSLRWDELRYEVIAHPRARIVLRVHMLGREEEWIRA